jgi:sialidase-1
MLRGLIAFAFFLFVGDVIAQKQVTVFESGKDGFAIFRIPSLLKLPNKTILAFAEGRVNGGADFGNIKLVMKCSRDNGKTWSSLKQIVSYDHWQVGNAAPVVDILDPKYPNGKIFLFYNTGNVHEMALRQAKGIREVWFISSVDDGENWTEPINITSQVHFPNGTMDGRVYESQQDWRAYANTPGHATQCIEGKYKGRIYIAANHSEGSAKSKFKDYFSHGYYTDNHGKDFKISESVNLEGSNEATAAFITGDRLILNARDQTGIYKTRITAYSSNGGESFDTAYYDNQLPDPVCEAAILNIGNKKNKSILAFVNNVDPLYRNQLTLKISFDEGATWPIEKLVDATKDEKLFKEDYTAYSDLVKMGRRKVGLLYEKNNYNKIVFSLIKW